jgi:hypothetical protein
MRVIICENDRAMDTVFAPPSATAFDAISSLASAGLYVIVALAALAHAPRDPRVRVFLAVAAAGIAPYCVTAQIWAWGVGPTFTKTTVVILALSLLLGSLALFHFAQIFPWRRPWIRAYARVLWAAYIVVPVLTGLVALLVPSFDAPVGAAISHDRVLYALMAVVIGLPAVLVVGVAVPFGGLMSLYRTWLAARAHRVEAARVTTWWMLVSQLGGGVLTILIVPLLHLIAPAGPWVTIAAALLFACAVMMPLAFAFGVWKLGVLALDIEALPQ